MAGSVSLSESISTNTLTHGRTEMSNKQRTKADALNTDDNKRGTTDSIKT